MGRMRSLSNIIGFDDAPFEKSQRNNVLLVGVAYSGPRLVGVVSGQVQPDGSDSTSTIIHLVRDSRFASQIQAVLLQGIAVAGFNIVDIHTVHSSLGIPVVTVSRRWPDMQAIRGALLKRVRGGHEKWALIERAGPMEEAGGVFVQRAGISLAETEKLIREFAINGSIPEPLRTAHLIAGGVVRGQSRGRT